MDSAEEDLCDTETHYIVPLEERIKAWHVTPKTEESVEIKPFSNRDVHFKVPKKTGKWLMNQEKIDHLRFEWINHECFGSIKQSESQERFERQKQAETINSIGKSLSLSQRCLDIANVYMHRFYIFHPLQMFQASSVCYAAVSLALKGEDERRPFEHTMNAMINVCQYHVSSEAALQKLSHELTELELFMSLTFGFDFDVQLPDSFIDKACECLELSDDHKKAFMHLASKTLRITPFCFRYPPQLIAAFSIFHISKRTKFQIPNSKKRPWFKSLDENIDLNMLEGITKEFWNYSLLYHRDVVEEPHKPVASTEGSVAHILPTQSEELFMMYTKHQLEESANTESSSKRCKFENERAEPCRNMQSNIDSVQKAQEILQRKIVKLPTQQATSTHSQNTMSDRPNIVVKPEELSIPTAVKYIKSTVPLKMKPPKPVDKTTDNSNLNFILSQTIGENYKSALSTKSRISNYKKPVSATNLSLKPAVDLKKVSKKVSGNKTSSSKVSHKKAKSDLSESSESMADKREKKTDSKVAGSKIRLCGSKSSAEDGEKIKKNSKEKKHKHSSKKEKHKLKKALKTFETVTTNNPLKIIIKSSGSNN